MADITKEKEQNISADHNAQMDVETLLRQSVLLPSQRKAFDRYMAESTNEAQKKEFQDVLNTIEQEVLQTYEEYRYTGKPVSEFLKWKDKEIAPLSKILTGRVNELSAKEFGEDEPEIGEAERDLPSDASDEAEKEEAEEKDKKEAEEAETELKEEQERTANGYTQEENEQWQKSLERRAEKQKEWDQFLKNRHEAERQAERDEELFRDHPEYFSDPYQEAADEAEREAEQETAREAEQAEFTSRQYLDAQQRAEEARFLRNASAHHIAAAEEGADGSGVAGIEITKMNTGDSYYAGEMLQGMLDGNLDRPSSSSSGSVSATLPSVDSDDGSGYEDRVNARTASKLAQKRFAEQKARKISGRGITNDGYSSEQTTDGWRGSVPKNGRISGTGPAGRHANSPSYGSGSTSVIKGVPVSQSGVHEGAFISDGSEESGSQSAIIARKKQENEITPPGVAAFTNGALLPGMSDTTTAEQARALNTIRSLKHDKTQIRSQKISDREAAKQYAERIAAAYKGGASVLRPRGGSASSDIYGPSSAMLVNGSGKKVPLSGTGHGYSSDGYFSGRGYTDATPASGAASGRVGADAVFAGDANTIATIRNRIIHGLPENEWEYKTRTVWDSRTKWKLKKRRYEYTVYEQKDAPSAFTERKITSVRPAGSSVEDSSTQVRDGSAGRSVIRLTDNGFEKESRSSAMPKTGGGIVGGTTDGVSIVGEGGVISSGSGIVSQIGQMAVKGAETGVKKYQQAFKDGVDGGSNGSSSSESKATKKMNSAARVMRQKIIGAAGQAVGQNPGVKTAANMSFRVVQKYSSAVKEGAGGEEDDDKEGTSEDPRAVEKIWRMRTRMNNVAKKKNLWAKIFGRTAAGGVAGKTVSAVGSSLGIAYPILFLILIIIGVMLVELLENGLMHQVDAQLPAAGRYSASGEELGDYLDDNATYADDDDDGSSLVPDDTTGTWTGAKLTREAGRIVGPSGGEETYYNMDMSGVVKIMRGMGNNDNYWVRDDGVKMLGDYVMVAANLSVHPRGSKVETSLGTGIVCDTGGFAASHPKNIDIATNW